MQEISKKTLVIMLIGAIIISLGGTFFSLSRVAKTPGTEMSGFVVTSAGKVNLSIVSLIRCNVTANVTFGEGNPGGLALTLTTDSVNTDGFNDCTTGDLCRGMEIENNGNVVLNVSMKSNVTGTSFFESPLGNISFWVRNGTRFGYENRSSTFELNNSVVINTSLPISDLEIAHNLSVGTGPIDPFSGSENDTITLEYTALIPAGEPSGEKAAKITVTCDQTADYD
jgi:hypothetical protein